VVNTIGRGAARRGNNDGAGDYVEDFSSSLSDSRQSFNDQRMVPRYSLLAVAEIEETASTMCIVGRMTEVSRKGCYVNTPSTLPVNSSLKVVISRDADTFTTNGKVIYVHDGIGMGIVFLDTAEDQLEILRSWLS
jgi:hypothetical protein